MDRHTARLPPRPPSHGRTRRHPGPVAAEPTNAELTDVERAALAEMAERGRSSSAYPEVHRTAPQTPATPWWTPRSGCAPGCEKLLTWTDPRGPRPDDQPGPLPSGSTFEQVLDQVSVYWFTGTAASSARLYAEGIEQVSAWISGDRLTPVRVPVGASILPAEVPRPSRRWAERRRLDVAEDGTVRVRNTAGR